MEVDMKDKTFIRFLVITLAVCIALTLAHMGYIMYAYLDGQARRDYAKWTEKERGQANQRPTF